MTAIGDVFVKFSQTGVGGGFECFRLTIGDGNAPFLYCFFDGDELIFHILKNFLRLLQHIFVLIKIRDIGSFLLNHTVVKVNDINVAFQDTHECVSEFVVGFIELAEEQLDLFLIFLLVLIEGGDKFTFGVLKQI
jgi:hypothetical protein